MANIFVTGINGQVGTATARALVEDGHHVIGLVRDINNKSQLDLHAACSIVRGDILDKELIRGVLSKYEVDYVLHLASQPIVRICNSDPYTAYMTNFVGCLNVLESIRTLKTKPKKTLIMVSDKAYGAHEKLPYTEESPLHVADTYCTSKACQDMVSLSYARTYDLPICVVRAGNIFGPDLNMSRLIPNTISKLLNGESPMLYSGVADNVREYLHVDNIVTAFKCLLEKGVSGEAYNVGGTQPRQTIEIIEMLRNKINPDIPVNIVEKDFAEIKEQYLDASKIRALGWTPHVSLDQGLDKTIAWYRERLNK